MKTIIIYESTHHGNTKKLVDAIAGKYDVETADLKDAGNIKLSEYGRIGFASGIAFGKFYNDILGYMEKNLPDEKEVFLLFTCGHYNRRFSDAAKKLAELRSCRVLGIYGCTGYDTYGPFKLVGGISKGHPTQEEIQGAVDFFGKLG